MLYLSTKSNQDTYTAYTAIHHNSAADGGLFLPFRLPTFDKDVITSLGSHSYCANMAMILNSFFGTGLTEVDLEYALGRTCTRYSTINPRVVIGELWHNAQWNFDHTVQAVSSVLRREGKDETASQWVAVAVRIASVFSIYGLLMTEEIISDGENVDIAMPVGDFSAPMAVWYARKMGLPVGMIVIGCNENSALWDLFNLGDMATGETVLETLTPLCDFNAPAGLSRLIYSALGADEAARYDQIRELGRHFVPQEEQFEQLREGIFTAVSSISRIDSVIRNVNSTAQYILSPYDALAYGALLDYRSKSGQGSTCLLLSERCPICDDKTVAYALGISTEELAKRLQGRQEVADGTLRDR